MFADCALEFFNNGGLEARHTAVGHDQAIGLEMRLVPQADEVRDEPKAALATLEKQVADRAMEEFGRIDVLLANAGILSLSDTTWSFPTSSGTT